MTPSLAEFYAPERRGRAFGVWARDYTIALAPNGGGYHIGQDYTTGRQPLPVPAILAGEVVRVHPREEVLGSVVVIRCTWLGETVYVQYSHLSKEGLPHVGQRIGQGERVGRLAAGPNARTATRANPAVPIWHTEWPGTGWDGIHLHLVISRHPDAGYSKVAGHRTLSAFLDPVPIIAAILASAAGGGARPFDPEEDDMFEAQDRTDMREMKRQLEHVYASLTPGVPNVKPNGEAFSVLIEVRDLLRNLKPGGLAKADQDRLTEIARQLEHVYVTTTPGVPNVKPNGSAYNVLVEARDLARTAATKNAVGAVDVDELAKQLREDLGAEVIEALLERLLASRRGAES